MNEVKVDGKVKAKDLVGFRPSLSERPTQRTKTRLCLTPAGDNKY